MKIKELSTDDVKAYRDTLMKLMHLCYEATCPGLADDAFCGEKVDGLYQYLKDGKANLFGAVDGDRLVGFHWCYEYSFLSQRRYHSAYAAVLPEDLSAFDEDHPLPLTKIKDNLLKNHGYSTIRVDGYDAAVVGCEEGTFLFIPPEAPDKSWEIKHLCGVPASDSVLLDFDGDGQLELGTISPFHGSSITIYHLDVHGNYVPQWKYPCPEAETEMVHATWAGTLLGRPAWVVGWRKGTKNTIAITYENGAYQTALIDQDTGCANLMHFVNKDGQDVLVGTNREIDEVAMYTITA